MGSDPAVLAARNRVARLYAHGQPTPEAEADARRALTEAKLERHVREALAAAPPLSTAQRQRISRLLVGGDDA